MPALRIWIPRSRINQRTKEQRIRTTRHLAATMTLIATRPLARRPRNEITIRTKRHRHNRLTIDRARPHRLHKLTAPQNRASRRIGNTIKGPRAAQRHTLTTRRRHHKIIKVDMDITIRCPLRSRPTKERRKQQRINLDIGSVPKPHALQIHHQPAIQPTTNKPIRPARSIQPHLMLHLQPTTRRKPHIPKRCVTEPPRLIRMVDVLSRSTVLTPHHPRRPTITAVRPITTLSLIHI